MTGMGNYYYHRCRSTTAKNTIYSILGVVSIMTKRIVVAIRRRSKNK